MTEAHGRKLLVIYVALMLAMLLAALDQTIVSTALPTIVNDLGGLSHLSWVVTGYLLASTATTQVWGKLGDQYGRKYLFLGCPGGLGRLSGRGRRGFPWRRHRGLDTRITQGPTRS